MLIENEELQCPKCGSLYLHHSRIDVFNRDEEDSTEGLHVRINTDDTMTIDRDIAGTPSGRRDGVSIRLWCEECDGISVFSLAQHKGQTLLRHEIVTPVEATIPDYSDLISSLCNHNKLMREICDERDEAAAAVSDLLAAIKARDTTIKKLSQDPDDISPR
jgi:hypothetical protein